MKAWNCKGGLYLLLCTAIGLGSFLAGCGNTDTGGFDFDDTANYTDYTNYSSDDENGINTQAVIGDFVGEWSGEIEGVLGGMSGTMTITLAQDGLLLEGLDVDITDTGGHVPNSFDITGTVGAIDSGIYTFSLRMNDSPGTTDPCIGWNVIGVASLNEGNNLMDISCLGIFCAEGGGSMGLSTGSLAIK